MSVQQTKWLADFATYGPPAQRVALGHFEPFIKEIESILLHLPAAHVRDRLALLLWKYARGEADRDGSGRELPSQKRQYIESLDKAARSLRDLLSRLPQYNAKDEAPDIELLLFASGIDATAILDLLEQLEIILAVTERAKTEHSKGGRPSENIELETLMVRLAKLYETAIGTRAVDGVIWDPAKYAFSGEFFETAQLVERAAASATRRRPKSNIALGKLLQRVFEPPAQIKTKTPTD